MARAFRLVVLLAAAAALTACNVKSTQVPALSGPSELGLALALQASPDTLTQNGSSQSTLTVFARDSNGQPARNVALRVEVVVSGKVGDFGTLSSHNITTGSDGQASVVYTAPSASLQSTDTVISLAVTPVGTNYANSMSRTVDIHLVLPSVITPPNDVLTAVIFMTPTSPKVLQMMFVDGAGSTAAPGRTIVRWAWDFGDGTLKQGVNSNHDYGVARNYLLKLTVTDDLGATATTSVVVTVTP
jgi:hypothetical protein